MAGLFDPGVAAAYARHRGYVDEEFIDVLAGKLPPGLVLDIGAGVGAPAAALVKRGFDVVALEPSEAMIEQARQLAPGLRVVRAIGEALPLRTRCAEAAIVLYVLHHADDPPLVLGEAARVVADDGVVVAVSGYDESERQAFFRSYFPTLTPELPGAQEIEEWAAGAGLEVAEVTRAVHWIVRSRTIDDAYLDLVENQMFAPLRDLNRSEFRAGIARLRKDRGRPLPAPEVTLAVLHRSAST